MKLVQVLPIGKVEPSLLQGLEPAISRAFQADCEVLRTTLDPAPAFHGERLQYHSSELLRLMQGFAGPGCWRLLGITSADLYIPILTFVFGEAQMGGPSAIVSCHRLRQESYGLPPDNELLRRRLAKEAVHELGHTVELTHCDDYRCVMASSHVVEGIDLKEDLLCAECQRRRTGA